ncbi:methyltransferase [Paenibacillus sp. FSL R7-0189]|uniref:methyltransferase domain-containing protein n=1 Tax=Paenibacillus sp. FSL R7-0189 TaxID=2921673 RepID=UPI0030D6EC69
MSLDNLKNYSRDFKDNIQNLIENGFLEEVKVMILEYEKIVEKDFELYSIKGTIALLEGDLKKAEKYFLDGLTEKPYDSDLIYNLAYLYEMRKENISAYRQYKKLLTLALGDLKEIVSLKITELEKLTQVNDYIERKKVLIIAYIFPPLGGSGVQRTLKFVKYLRDFGWEPVVLTVDEGDFPFTDSTLEKEIPQEIEVIRIREKKDLDIHYINKLIQMYQVVVNNNEIMMEYVELLKNNSDKLNELAFLPDHAIVFAREVLDQINDFVNFNEIDLIYSTSGPYSDHLIGYFLKNKYEKRWVCDFRDEWTNNPYAEFDKDSILFKVLMKMEENILKSCDKILTTTPLATQNYINNFGVDTNKIETITNGYDEEDFFELLPNNIQGKNEKFRIMHNGILYMIRTPETFLKAVYNLVVNNILPREKIEIYFTLTENDDHWREVAEQLGIDDLVNFFGYLNHNDSLSYASNADLLLLIVGPGEKNKSVYPGKVFEYLRLGKRILALSPSGSLVEALINKTSRGENYEFEDVQGMQDYIIRMYKEWEAGSYSDLSINGDIKRFERRQLTRKLSDIFTETIKEKIRFSFDISERDENFYNDLYESGGWNQSYFKHYSEIHYIDIWMKATEMIRDVENPKIIDIGCGPGQFANLLLDNHLTNYRGMDFSQEAIKHAKIRNDRYRSSFSVDDVYTSNIFDEDYNIAVLFEILEHLDGDLEILKKLKKNTKVLFSVPNFYSEGHVRWFNSQLEVAQRYKAVVGINDIYTFDVGGENKIYLVFAEKE